MTAIPAAQTKVEDCQPNSAVLATGRRAKFKSGPLVLYILKKLQEIL